MDNSIATFLSLAVPWAETGYVSVHWPFLPPNSPPGTKPQMPGRAFKDINTAVRYANARRQYGDLFVCMSLQAQATPGKNSRGQSILKAMRRKELALLLRAFWLDVDIKNGFFRDTQHALEVFGAWRRAVGLPEPSLLVLTGSGGFHVYWILDEPIMVDRWQPVADALANAAVESFKPMPGPDGEERRLDTNVTINPAQLLRIPDSFNFKHNPPQLAQLVHQGVTYPFSVIDNALSKYKGIYSPAKLAISRPTHLKASPVFAGMAKPVPLAAGLDDRWRPTGEEVADACPWFARVLHTRGAGCSEPEWFTSLQVAYFCQEAGELAHDLSDAHPTYTEEETDKKFALVEESHASERLGWPKCQTIHLNGGAPECRLCPHLPEGKSPLNFVAMAPAEQPVPIVPRTRKDEQPLGYIQDDEGTVWKLGKKEEDPSERLSFMPILNVRTEAQRDDGSGRFAIAFDTYIDATRSKTVVVSYDELGELRLFTRCLGRYGMMVISTEQLRRYLISFSEQLRNRKMTSANSEPYGWSKVDGKRAAFVYTERCNCAGNTPVMPLDANMALDYQPMGTLECWKRNAALITSQQRYDLIALLVTGIAGPLVDIAGVDGVVVHAYGESGVGKSHTMRVSQSTWARPVKAEQALRDTANAVEGRLGKLRNLPLFFDEIKGEDNMRKIVEIIFLATQGKTKARMAPTSDLKEVYEFCTLLAIASNNSLVDFINTHMPTSTAGLIRVFEVPIRPNTSGAGLISSTVAQRAMGELRENYGHPGVLCANYFGKNIESVEHAVASACDGFNDIVKGTNDERFWVATMAVLSVATMIGNKLGLFEVDQKKLAEFLVNNFYRLRSVVGSSPADMTKPESVLRYFQDYIASRQRAMIITDRVPKGQGRAPSGSVNIRQTEIRDGVRVRYAYDDNLVRVSAADFRDWLKNHRKVGPHEIVQAAKASLPVRFLKASLATGTNFSSVREEVIELNLTNYPDFINLN